MSALATRVAEGTRRRNPRGMGRLLADEIIDGVLRLIDEGAKPEAITLRAVAREVGISAPSIYAHFRNRDQIVTAVTGRIFDEIHDRLVTAREAAGHEPVARLLAACRAYVAFGLDSPARYRIAFSCEFDLPTDGLPLTLAGFGGREDVVGAEAFLVLVHGIEACIVSGDSSSTDPSADAVAIWLYLHGMVSLRNALPGFPWPPVEQMLADNAGRLARLGTGG